MTSESPQTVELGRIVGVFGIQGWIKVFSYTEPREAILDYRSWLLGVDGGWRQVDVEAGRRQGKSVLAKLDACENRDQAEALVGLDIAVRRDALPGLDGQRFYWTDLVGLEVCHTDGRRLGVVGQMLETGAHDVMLVEGDIQRLIPFAMGAVVQEVDLDSGTIRVDWEWDE
ncbi:MAG: ribosome maturation factor RimM [Pseudomonadota bacterium]